VPNRIAAQQFHQTAEDHQPEEEPAKQPDPNPRFIREKRQEAGFQKQHVPLERQKILARRADGKP